MALTHCTARDQVNLLNFMATQEGLEDQMLGITVAREEAELEARREQLVLEDAENKRVQKEIEDTILDLLKNSEGNILDDEVSSSEHLRRIYGISVSLAFPHSSCKENCHWCFIVQTRRRSKISIAGLIRSPPLHFRRAPCACLTYSPGVDIDAGTIKSHVECY